MRRRVSVLLPDGRGNILVDDKPGDVEIPGGGIEEGESVEEATVREVMEEAGLRPVDVGTFGQRPTVADGEKTYWRKAEGAVSDKRRFNTEGDGMQRTRYMPKPELKEKIRASDEHPEVKEDEAMAIEKLSYQNGVLTVFKTAGLYKEAGGGAGIDFPIGKGWATDANTLPHSDTASKAKSVAKDMAKKKKTETTSGPGGTTLSKRKGGPGGATT